MQGPQRRISSCRQLCLGAAREHVHKQNCEGQERLLSLLNNPRCLGPALRTSSSETVVAAVAAATTARDEAGRGEARNIRAETLRVNAERGDTHATLLQTHVRACVVGGAAQNLGVSDPRDASCPAPFDNKLNVFMQSLRLGRTVYCAQGHCTELLSCSLRALELTSSHRIQLSFSSALWYHAPVLAYWDSVQ